MNPESARLSESFQMLYCDPALFDSYSAFHPVSFRNVLPIQTTDRVTDDAQLISAEKAHLANPNDETRRNVIESYKRCGLLSETDASNTTAIIDFFDADFFDLMGLVYANADMFVCALRWYREHIAWLESQNPKGTSDDAVYASVGYCLYSMGLFAEAISWSKSCLGPRETADNFCQAIILGATQAQAGSIRMVERVGPRMRFTVACSDPAQGEQLAPRITQAVNWLAPFREVSLAWVPAETAIPECEPNGYPFRRELGAHTLLRHKMNLLFALCAQSDVRTQQGYFEEAKRLLWEAALLEPQADFIKARL